MNISELEKMVESLSYAVTELENITGCADIECEEEYRENLESAAYYVASLGEDIVTFLSLNRIKDVQDDANNYFKIDSLDARMKAELLATHFEKMTYSNFADILNEISIRNFF